MSFSPDQIFALQAPLEKANVRERTQAGRQLSYVEAWKAIEEANRIFGFDAWSRETVELRQLGEPRLTGDKYRVGYAARVRITVNANAAFGEPPTTIIREGCGFGQGIDKDPDQAHESALKEAESDAMKRALMTFGNPFGLALYDKTQANVASEPPAPKASEVAINLLRGCSSDQGLFKEAWEKNRDGWKAVMYEDEYREVVAVMKEIASTFTKPALAA